MHTTPKPAEQVRAGLESHADSLGRYVTQMREMLTVRRMDELCSAFCKSRDHYKKMESLLEFYFPALCKAFNGPVIDKTEEYDDKVILPTGFQVVEEMLFPFIDTASFDALETQLGILASSVVRLEKLIATAEFSDANIFEALRLEVLRIMSLGISGFDSPVALRSLEEAEAALAGMQEILSCYYHAGGDQGRRQALENNVDGAITYLRQHTDFDSFDRAAFITAHLDKVSATLYAYQQTLTIPNNKWTTALRMDLPTFLGPDAFTMEYFAPGHDRSNTPDVIALGNALFFDPVLSGNNSRSCASCHHPDKAFTDGRARSVAFNFEGEVLRNAPTLINSGFQRSQFWDQRVQFLEDQITEVMKNPDEMHGHIEKAATKLAASEEYRALFASAFAVPSESAVTDRNIQAALAWYVRSLTGLNARFDHYLQGDRSQLTEDEVRGFNLFMGKAKCGTCHFFPLFNGTVPPTYTETESEILGVPLTPDTIHASIDGDPGKFSAYPRELYKHAFKTPTVRNAALTAPYMHNGVYQSLEEVLDFYNRGGGAGIGAELPHQTLPPDPLLLTASEERQIIAFLHTLTDTTGLVSIPKRLPSFEDPLLVDRKVGGEY